MGRSADEKLAAHARRHLGVFTLAHAARFGVARSTVYARVASGRYHQRWPGVFAIAGAPDGREARWLAARWAVGGDAVLGHQQAAELHGLEHGRELDPIHLVVATRVPTPRPGIVVHRSSTFPRLGITRVRQHRATGVEWTVCDLAGQLDMEQLRRAVAQALRGRATDVRRLVAAVEARQRFAGRRALRALLRELSPLETDARSELEARFLRLTTDAGIPPTALNHRVRDVFGRTRYLDAVYLPELVPIELDSMTHHGTLLDWHDDLRRERAIVADGWRPMLRFSAADLRDHPEEVIAVIRCALEAARRELHAAS
jgi:hypothetical protein